MSYFQRKFHLALPLPDGNVWTGFINCEADTKGELHTKEEVRGMFFVEKFPEGWTGLFFLDNGVSDRRRAAAYSTSDSVITTGVFRPAKQFGLPLSAKEAEAALEYLKPVQYTRHLRINARLQDCLTGAEETHEW